jgi:enoyl-CoA hydratase
MKFFKIAESTSSLSIQFLIPATANALSLEAARELKKIVKKYSKLKKPVIVSGHHPRVFCSGGNLSDYKVLKGKASGLKVNREITKILDGFAAWPVVKLAIIEGDVLGGGMEWLARFDFRWSTPNAFFAFWQRRIGLSSGWGGGRAWARKIGEDQVRRLLIDGKVLSAQESLSKGLVDRVVCSWKIHEEAQAWAVRMNEGVVPRLTQWTVARESMIFSSLWLAPKHAAVLKNWKR